MGENVALFHTFWLQHTAQRPLYVSLFSISLSTVGPEIDVKLGILGKRDSISHLWIVTKE